MTDSVQMLELIGSSWIIGLIVGIGLLVQVLKTKVVDRANLQLVALAIGAVAGGVITQFVYNESLSQGIFYGVIIGLAATGGYENVKRIFQILGNQLDKSADKLESSDE